jgi:hypothetical protein
MYSNVFSNFVHQTLGSPFMRLIDELFFWYCNKMMF